MRISKLPEATAVTDSDIAVIVQDGETRQIPRELLIPNVPDGITSDGSVIQLTADGNPIGTGAALPSLTVDSEISATSENPVQNKVVTAALSELEGKAKYRIIADITLTEDTQKIEITKDDSGNPFSLKSVFILFRGTFTQTADYNMHFTFNGGLIYQMYSKFSATAGRYYGLWARSERIGTFKTGNDTLSIWQSTYPQSLCTNFLDNGTGQGLSGNNTALKGDICARFYHTATNVRFGCYTADNLMAAGSNILIVGVDDNG